MNDFTFGYETVALINDKVDIFCISPLISMYLFVQYCVSSSYFLPNGW